MNAPGERLRRFSPFLLIAVSMFLWLRGITRSLDLDESITFSIVADGPVALVQRAIQYQGQSPLFYLVEYAFLYLPLPVEVALRLPSLLFMAGAVVVLFSLARAVGGEPCALVATVLFCLSETVIDQAGHARSYGPALFWTISAARLALSWAQTGSRPYLLGAVFSAGMAVHLHYVFGLFLALLCVTAPLLRSRRLRENLCDLVWTAGFGTFVLLPGIPQLLLLFEKRHLISFTENPSVAGFLTAICTPAFALIITASIGNALLLSGETTPQRPVNRATVLVLALWGFLPPLLLLALQLTGSLGLFAPRYFSYSLPALAILVGYSIARFHRHRLALFIAVFSCIFGTARELSRDLYAEEWREAVAASRRISLDLPVFVASGLIESQDPRWVNAHRDYLLSPVAPYPLPNPLYPLPALCDGDCLHLQLLPKLGGEGLFLLRSSEVSVSDGHFRRTEDYWVQVLHGLNFMVRQRLDYRNVTLLHVVAGR